jgi:hypothetical protein
MEEFDDYVIPLIAEAMRLFTGWGRGGEGKLTFYLATRIGVTVDIGNPDVEFLTETLLESIESQGPTQQIVLDSAVSGRHVRPYAQRVRLATAVAAIRLRINPGDHIVFGARDGTWNSVSQETLDNVHSLSPAYLGIVRSDRKGMLDVGPPGYQEYYVAVTDPDGVPAPSNPLHLAHFCQRVCGLSRWLLKADTVTGRTGLQVVTNDPVLPNADIFRLLNIARAYGHLVVSSNLIAELATGTHRLAWQTMMAQRVPAMTLVGDLYAYKVPDALLFVEQPMVPGFFKFNSVQLLYWFRIDLMETAHIRELALMRTQNLARVFARSYVDHVQYLAHPARISQQAERLRAAMGFLQRLGVTSTDFESETSIMAPMFIFSPLGNSQVFTTNVAVRDALQPLVDAMMLRELAAYMRNAIPQFHHVLMEQQSAGNNENRMILPFVDILYHLPHDVRERILMFLSADDTPNVSDVYAQGNLLRQCLELRNPRDVIRARRLLTFLSAQPVSPELSHVQVCQAISRIVNPPPGQT